MLDTISEDSGGRSEGNSVRIFVALLLCLQATTELILTPPRSTAPRYAPRPSQDIQEVRGWDVKGVGRWLRSKGLGQYCGSFEAHHVDGRVLSELTLEELRDELKITSLG